MPDLTLEKLDRRLTLLEETVARLTHAESGPMEFKDWRKAAGMFRDRELQREIDEAGRQIREAERQDTSP